MFLGFAVPRASRLGRHNSGKGCSAGNQSICSRHNPFRNRNSTRKRDHRSPPERNAMIFFAYSNVIHRSESVRRTFLAGSKARRHRGFESTPLRHTVGSVWLQPGDSGKFARGRADSLARGSGESDQSCKSPIRLDSSLFRRDSVPRADSVRSRPDASPFARSMVLSGRK
jgi:hypothetical protein